AGDTRRNRVHARRMVLLIQAQSDMNTFPNWACLLGLIRTTGLRAGIGPPGGGYSRRSSRGRPSAQVDIAYIMGDRAEVREPRSTAAFFLCQRP
ncbi:MAG: hypothetical protein QOG21_130, partial [Actinomycetota bacterium]|nr:hypothetical protein [Actinomycetota bacterium]